ncbi:glycoside hydrolase family 47 protein [Microdochium trichocladiopsis]|uniref:alpha-1,2-Mannosidase n=1 Tax=Microdochium trichocladiopsis TaxID=1682393 RepID=A0A9P8Y4Y2_9PEZI|nr:glycoside hydrolase family 47 protein [Microdochium trichocladiopsis]KAH7027651.1 glycoside hydrolase family 47 protein [Microdochium trichocladiopsis]
MRPARVAELRQQAVDMFYHGFDNYMSVAFPEDELRPVSCTPLTRDPANPANIGLNDVLGNYSLTLIDSLSTLAILASAPEDERGTGPKALRDFQDGVAALVEQYGDGRKGPSGKGARARGFDVDSKVQVFETVIRGVGGLLSAHLFAVGHLPINGYEARSSDGNQDEQRTIPWPNGFSYNGQLLRLALDLAQRLLPAFYTATGIPYPRVNLRHGIPFYLNSPLHGTAGAQNEADPSREITETCSAGAGSLVLEFTVLSRLTDDPRFEQAAKRAFWAVWARRSNIGLIGAGVDAESGHWIGALSGIGAGIDSFFEYALKSHILLSGHQLPNTTLPRPGLSTDAELPDSWLDPNSIYQPLSEEDNSSDTFLQAWHHAHAAIKRHLYSGQHHPHYVNAHVSTGSPQAYWIDSLGAYYSGLLALAGEMDEAIETHLLYTALWTRYSALPERWSVRDGQVEGGLGWWPGRPEFIESTYYLYRATKDPWYLYAGEMVLRDIKRRCWTDCGWSGLQDVRTGQLSDRMESFFLGETAKYMYLLFDPDHPLNKLDAAYVFTTEGHPLIIPSKAKHYQPKHKSRNRAVQPYYDDSFTNACPKPPTIPPLSGSATAARKDFFNAATLIRLHQIAKPDRAAGTNIGADSEPGETPGEPTEDHTVFPWTLPSAFLPNDGVCTISKRTETQVIEFPANTQSGGSAFNLMLGSQHVMRLGGDGLAINRLAGLKIAMAMEEPPESSERGWRITGIGNLALGRDEKVFISRDSLSDIVDPLFNRIRDSVLLHIVVQLNPTEQLEAQNGTASPVETQGRQGEHVLEGHADFGSGLLSSLLQQITSVLREPIATLGPEPSKTPQHEYEQLTAIIPTGPGVAPLPSTRQAPDVVNILNNHNNIKANIGALSWQTIFLTDTACDGKLPDAAPRNHQVIVMRRGGCSFSEKLANIPSFAPSSKSLQLVIVVSGEAHESTAIQATEEDPYDYNFIRPLLDEVQKTPSGVLRRYPIPMVMIQGGDAVYDLLRDAQSLGFRRRYHVESQGLKINNLVVV